MHGKFSINTGFSGKSSTFINLANENNDCISCILVHLISFMFIAIYLAFHRIRVAFPRKFIGESVTGIGKTVLQIYIAKLLDKKFVVYYFITCQLILLQLTHFFNCL